MSEQPQEKPVKRPRDEDFDIIPTVRKKHTEPVKEPRRDQNRWVILGIIGAGVVIALLSVLIFHVVRKHQRTVISVVSTTIAEESGTGAVFTESETTEPESITIDEKTKAPTESSSDTEAEEESTIETEAPETAASEAESTAEETLPESTEVPETPLPEETGEAFEYGGVIYQETAGGMRLVKCYSADQVMEMGPVHDTVVIEVAADAYNGWEPSEYVNLPAGLLTIGDRAFANCPNLKEVYIPDSVSLISDSCFENTPNVTIIAGSGTYAAAYAQTHGIGFREGNRISPLVQ